MNKPYTDEHADPPGVPMWLPVALWLNIPVWAVCVWLLQMWG